MVNLGFLSLGIMGKPMAFNLLATNNTVHVYDINSEPVKEIEGKGAKPCICNREVAEKADIIFNTLPDTSVVEAVLFDKGGVGEGIKAGKIVLDMNSISSISTKEFTLKLEALGIDMLDASVYGGEAEARNASLSIMVGVKPEVFAKVQPFFQIMDKNIIQISRNGDGQTYKAATQDVVAGTLEAVSEALVFASKAGTDPGNVREALLGGFAQSRILELRGECIIKRTLAPSFRGQLHQKYLNLALLAARSLKLTLSVTTVVAEILNAVDAQGCCNLYHSALVHDHDGCD